jgi:hypothetical protein
MYVFIKSLLPWYRIKIINIIRKIRYIGFVLSELSSPRSALLLFWLPGNRAACNLKLGEVDQAVERARSGVQ